MSEQNPPNPLYQGGIWNIFTSHGFELSEEEQALFERFLTLFIEYNSHTNLSAIRDEEGIMEKHFVDSLYGASIIAESFVSTLSVRGDSRKLLDIWSGWGFPGIPLKIVIPELDVTPLDSVGKKVKAMNHFVEQLGLKNITAIQERAEILAKNPEYAGQYDFVVSRATAYMSDILTWSLPFLAKDGKIILYKMPSEDERRDMQKIMKKLGLILEWELPYMLERKERILYIFRKK
jgi:16S rRNA (guanine527-N7)-methyltransferase